MIASACSGSKTATSNSPSKAGKSGVVAANIPGPGAVAAVAPPQLPPRDASMPSDTIPLTDLYQQGKTDVLR